MKNLFRLLAGKRNKPHKRRFLRSDTYIGGIDSPDGKMDSVHALALQRADGKWDISYIGEKKLGRAATAALSLKSWSGMNTGQMLYLMDNFDECYLRNKRVNPSTRFRPRGMNAPRSTMS